MNLDKIRWALNKKPHSAWFSYLVLVGSGFLPAMFFILGLISFELVRVHPIMFPVGLGLLGLTFLTGFLMYRIDRRQGYVDAIHKHYLERREDLGKKLGKLD